jgi:hypothetical protein
MPVTFICRYCGFNASGTYGSGAGFLPPKGWIVSKGEVECPRPDCKENYRTTPTRQELKPLAAQHPLNGTKKQNLCLNFTPEKARSKHCAKCGCSEFEHGLMKEMAGQRDSVPQ